MTDPMGYTLSDLVRWMGEVATARLPGSPRTVVLKCTRATLQPWLDRVQQALTRHDAFLAVCRSALHDLEGLATRCEPHGDTRAAACRHHLGEDSQGLMCAEEHAMSPSTAWCARRPNTSPGDLTAAPRQQRQPVRMANVSRDVLVAALQQLVLDVTFERTHALTQAIDDLIRQPPQDHWELDGLVKSHPDRDLVEVGRAFVRLAGEAWLTVADTHDQSC
jgi:hypothetical protein